MKILPPGTLLQLMYLRERLQKIKPGRFIEVGPGSGEITELLLSLGWTGQSFDLEVITIERLRERFFREIAQGRYQAIHADFLSLPANTDEVNLIISCMVMEHLDQNSETRFMEHSAKLLSIHGAMIGLVPSSPAHWGIEDDIAGHHRRYTRSNIQSLMTRTNWTLNHLVGLTFPVSNILLPASNFLVNYNEKSRLGLTLIERTKKSGYRDVKFKTRFPPLMGLLLNQYVLWPLHMLQKVFKNSTHSLVLYFEARPKISKE